MKTIYKYDFKINDIVELELPEGAEVLCVQVQYDTPKLWAIVNTANEVEVRIFRVYGTGHKMTHTLVGRYISTIQLRGGSLVFHIFEDLKKHD